MLRLVCTLLKADGPCSVTRNSFPDQTKSPMIDVLQTANFRYTEITFDLQGTYNADLYHGSQAVFITKFCVLKDA